MFDQFCDWVNNHPTVAWEIFFLVLAAVIGTLILIFAGRGQRIPEDDKNLFI